VEKLPDATYDGISEPNLLKTDVKPCSISLIIFARGCSLVFVGS
jgi:hypothetical protein